MKKIVSLLLILAMAMAILPGITAYAAVPASAKITGALQPVNTHNDPYLEDINLSYDTVYEFPLTADMFEWDIMGANLYGEPLSHSNVSHNRISVRTAHQTGAFSSIFEAPAIVYKSSRASGGQSTATVQIKVKKGATISSRKSFGATIFLNINGSRDYNTEYEFSGSVEPGGGSDVFDGDYVDISDGSVLQPSSLARNVELYLGEGVTMKTNLSAHRKYSGTAYSNITSADERLMRQYPSIDNIITVKQSGLEKTGQYVKIDAGYTYHVYNAEQKYLGRSSSTLPYSSKYYLSTEKINMGVIDDPVPSPTENTDDHISRESAVSQTKLALGSSKAASVQYKDADCVLISTLQEMNTVAKNAGGTVSLVVDTTAGSGTVQGRISIPAASAVNLNKNAEIELRVFSDDSHTQAQKAKFEKWYKNKMAVVSLNHQGTFGMRVRIDAKVSLVNSPGLYVYSFDKVSNTLTHIKDAGATIDKNGYVHFNTTVGGDIIITDSALQKR